MRYIRSEEQDLAIEEIESPLAFNEKKQLAVLGHLLCDQPFFMYCKDIVKKSWFQHANVARAYEAMLQFYEKHERPGGAQEILSSPAIIGEEQSVRTNTETQIKEALRQRGNFGIDALKTEMTQWLHSQVFFQAVTKAQRSYNLEHFDECYATVEEAIKYIRTTSFGNDKVESFNSFMEDMEQLKAERKNALTTGLSLLDRLLLPPADGEALNGCLLPGDTTVLMAPVNTGKTTTAINFIRPNILKGKHVLFLTHEGRPADIKKKIWCAMLGVSEIGLFDLQNTAEGQLKMDVAKAFLNKFLTYIPMNRAGQRVEDVVSTIRRKQDELMAKNNGVGFSMLVDDYPALLTCDQAKQGQLAKRNIDDIVYGQFVQLGLEYKMHVLAAIQVNREGSKINKNVSDGAFKPLLTMENVAESFSVMMQATNVITLNRDPDDKVKHFMTMYLDKSRSSETGYAVVCKTNFNQARTHGDDLGAAFYRGHGSMSDKINDVLLATHMNAEIPESAFIDNDGKN